MYLSPSITFQTHELKFKICFPSIPHSHIALLLHLPFLSKMAQTTNTTTTSTSSSHSETPWFENVLILDVEKQETSKIENLPLPITEIPIRITRSQSLTHLSSEQNFTHPNSHLKTTEAEIVDFEGEDDPVSLFFIHA